ncbi:hypothetical protein, partial [Salmonella sp. SAL4355]|uniref:hypothetical protein n=1 Tax=Salmonella sp. SAL4355 TaxID=3159876 RepID=UPI00397A3215
IQESILAGGLDDYRAVVESLGADHDLFDIAAAAVKMAQEIGAGATAEQEIASVPIPAPAPTAKPPRDRKDKRKERPGEKRGVRQRDKGYA